MEVKHAAIYDFGKGKQDRDSLRVQAIKYLLDDGSETSMKVVDILREEER